MSGTTIVGARSCGLGADAAWWQQVPGLPHERIRGGAGCGYLTAREREVTFWVGRGLTNREIAAELLVSVKTVEYHVANVFAKLGIISRHELRDAHGDMDPGDICPGDAGSLTPREREVAFWAGRGLTNREIAAELFVSVKTVEFHVANVFTKLGVISRHQLRNRGPGQL